MNNVSLIGNISTEIDLRYTPNGVAVAKFNLAVTNPYNKDKTNFIPIEVWRAPAENVSNFCQKGSKVGVTGQIDIDQYEKDGQKRTFTKVTANNVEFLTPKGSNQGAGNQNSGQPVDNSGNQSQVDDDPFNGDVSDDSLPF